ncbi:MAG: DUF4917 family protein, partial [Proteobacteria bacterium]
FYMHGALNIYALGNDTTKLTSRIPLLQAIQYAEYNARFPVLISEGHSDRKIFEIERNDYLKRCFASFSAKQGNLFTFGFGFGPSDQHIVKSILTSSYHTCYVSVFSGLSERDKTDFCGRVVNLLSQPRPNKLSALSVFFYESQSAAVWR